MDQLPAEKLRQLIDRQEIEDCVLRFCRGIDRMDREMVLSAYHEGAKCDHGAFAGDVEEYVDFSMASHRERQHAHNLFSLNHRCEFESADLAHAETYWFMLQQNREAPLNVVIGGRYLDRFERRDGRWAIAFRRCILEFRVTLGDVETPPEVAALLARAGVASRDRDDPSYRRD